MINLIRKVRINDRIPPMFYKGIKIEHAYRDGEAIIDAIEYDPTDYSKEYFTIESLEDNNTIRFYKYNNRGPGIRYHVSTDLNTWTEYDDIDASWTINKNEKLYFKSYAFSLYNSPNDPNYSGGWRFGSDKKANISGNARSLIDGDNFANKTTFISANANCFCEIFARWTNLIDASKLVLCTLDLTNGANCYNSMFFGCTSLVHAPALPATTLVGGCYCQMFIGCTSLVAAPDLPATNAPQQCYERMFYRCSALEKAPAILPATTLSLRCYYEMFYGCSSLIAAPELPALQLAQQCYYGMFQYCTKLNYIKCLVETYTNDSLVFTYWVLGVSSTGTFVKNTLASYWPTATSNNLYAGIPDGWTVQNAAS